MFEDVVKTFQITNEVSNAALKITNLPQNLQDFKNRCFYLYLICTRLLDKLWLTYSNQFVGNLEPSSIIEIEFLECSLLDEILKLLQTIHSEVS